MLALPGAVRLKCRALNSVEQKRQKDSHKTLRATWRCTNSDRFWTAAVLLPLLSRRLLSGDPFNRTPAHNGPFQPRTKRLNLENEQTPTLRPGRSNGRLREAAAAKLFKCQRWRCGL